MSIPEILFHDLSLFNLPPIKTTTRFNHVKPPTIVANTIVIAANPHSSQKYCSSQSLLSDDGNG